VNPGATSIRLADGRIIESIAFGGNSGMAFLGRGIGGTRALPTATADAQPLVVFQGMGHDGAAYSGAQATQAIIADGLWSGTNRGTYYYWTGTPNSSTTNAEWMRLKGGYLGVGSFSGTPVARIHLKHDSDTGYSFLANGTTKAVRIFHTSAGSAIEGVDNTGTSTYQPLYIGGSQVEITISGGSKMSVKSTGFLQAAAYGAGTLTTDASGNITASSDARLKTVDGDFTRSLAAINQITPKVYHWRADSGLDTSRPYAGLIAQNVQEAIPEAVSVDPAGMLTLQDRPLIAALINAVKELSTQNAELESRLRALEANAARN
jgi:Chaperone of endosialidase